MAEEIAYKVSVDSGNAGKSLKDLKKEFKEIQNELSGLDKTSSQYTETLKRLGQTKDDIALLNDQVNAFADDAGKIKAVGNVVQGLGGAFAAAQGAAALFGNENEDLQKTLVKLQAVMAFQQGLEGIKNLGDSFKVLWQIIRANPLGAILTAITALTAAGIALYNSMDKSSDATKDLNRELSLQKEITETLTRSTDRQIQLLEAQGASEQTIIEVKKKLIQHQILEIETSIKLHQSKIEDIKTNNSITESYWEMIKAIQLRTGQEAQAAATQQIINALKLQRAKEDLEAIKKEKEELADLRTKFEVLEIQKTKVVEKNAEERNKIKEDERLKDIKHWEDLQEIRRQMRWADIQEQTKIQEEEEKKAEEAFLKELERLARGNEARLELYRLQGEGELSVELEYLQKKKEAELANAELTASERALIEERYDNQIRATKEESFNQQLDAYQQLGNATMAIADLVFAHQLRQAQGNAQKEREIRKKQFNINKAFGIVNATIDGVQSVQKALNNPYPLNLILAAASGIMAAANIAKIASQKFNDTGASGGGGGVGSIGTISAPNITPPSQGGTQLNSDGTVKIPDSAMQPTVKAVVVETDVTKTQKKVGAIEQNSKF